MPGLTACDKIRGPKVHVNIRIVRSLVYCVEYMAYKQAIRIEHVVQFKWHTYIYIERERVCSIVSGIWYKVYNMMARGPTNRDSWTSEPGSRNPCVYVVFGAPKTRLHDPRPRIRRTDGSWRQK